MDFIFSGEEEGRLVVEGNYIFFHDREVYFFAMGQVRF